MIHFSKNLSWTEFKNLADHGSIAVMAIGAHEEHGPHCSLLTDSIISNALAERITDKISGILLPQISYGESWSVSDFPGTISLEPETLTALVLDIARCLKRGGIRAFIIVNGHYGNMSPVTLAARRMRSEENFPVLILNFPKLESIAQEICESKPAGGSFFHADEFETSVVLAEYPEGVKMDKAQANYPIFPSTYGETQILLSSFNPMGVFGDPTKATAEKGKLFLNAFTDSCMEIVQEFIQTL